MERREFLQKGLALGTATLLPGAGLTANGCLSLASETSPALNPLTPEILEWLNYYPCGTLDILSYIPEDDAEIDYIIIEEGYETPLEAIERRIAEKEQLEATIDQRGIRSELDAKIEKTYKKFKQEYYPDRKMYECWQYRMEEAWSNRYAELRAKILKEDYGIDWMTPAERNSLVCYD